MCNFIHKNLASGKWFELSHPEQMAKETDFINNYFLQFGIFIRLKK
jgi:hypothetical protein